MKIGWLVLSVLAFVGLWQTAVSTVQANSASQDREFHQTYNIAPNSTVGIYNTSGAIRITTWNENRVKVDAVKNGRRAEDFARVEIQVTANPDRVEIRVIYPNGFNWRGGGVSVDFDIKVPRTAAVSPANSTSGNVDVTGPVERLIVRTTSGDIIARDVTDTASLTTTSGNINATRIGGELRANATSGELTISEVNSRLFANATSGSIRAIQIRDDATAIVSSGEVKLEKIGGKAIARSNSGGVVVNEVGGDVQATSLTDNVTITNVRGRVVVSAISGNVVLRNVEEGARVNAVSGSVNISDSKGRIEITTTSDNIILTNLDSRDVTAKTTSGNVQFTGKIHDDGHYEFESFNGEVVLVLPPDSNFNLYAKTHNGSVNTEFPLQLTRTTGGSIMSGTVGKGGAEIRAGSFSGSVRIRKIPR